MEVTGLAPGKKVGGILRACLELVTETPEYNDRETLLVWITSGPKILDL